MREQLCYDDQIFINEQTQPPKDRTIKAAFVYHCKCEEVYEKCIFASALC